MHWYSNANKTPRMLDSTSDSGLSLWYTCQLFFLDGRFINENNSDKLLNIVKLFREYEIWVNEF